MLSKVIVVFTEVTVPPFFRGFAYVEYETAQMASDAVICMNLVNFRGLPLRVGKVIFISFWCWFMSFAAMKRVE
jgi:hypothetical protein